MLLAVSMRTPPRPGMHDSPGMLLRCYPCSHGQHHRCDGSPELGSCRCRQCHTQTIMAMAETALASNNIGKIRTALEAVTALQSQTITQKRKRAYRAPVILSCSVCGKPVPVREKRRPGLPIYCRDKSTCRWKAFKARQREQEAREPTQTPAQVPEFPLERGSGYEPPDQPQHPQPTPEQVYPAALWLAARAG